MFRRFFALLFGIFERSGGWFTLAPVRNEALLPPPQVHPSRKDLVELENEQRDEGINRMGVVGVKLVGFGPDGMARWMNGGSNDVFCIVVVAFRVIILGGLVGGEWSKGWLWRTLSSLLLEGHLAVTGL